MSGQLVEQWPFKPLHEIATVLGGSSAPQGEHLFEGGTYPFIRTADVGKIRFGEIFETKDYLNEIGIEKLRHFKKGTILLPKSGASTFLNHRVIMGMDAYVASHLAGIKADEAIIDPRYLLYALSRIKAQDLLQENAYPSLNLSLIKGIEIPVPPLEEQQRIVSILDEAFEQVANTKAQTMMNLQGAYNVFTSFLDTIINDTNNDWKDTVLGDEYDVRDGTHDSPKYHDEGHYLITSKNLKREGLTYAKAKFISPIDYHQINKRSKVDKGDVLFAMIGTIGNPVVIEEEPDFAIKNVALFKVGEKNGKFLKYLLQSKSKMTKMLCDASGTTQRFVSLRYLRGFPIRLPSDEDQNLIVGKLDELFDNTEQLAKKYSEELDCLDELKQSILQEAFNGTL